VQNFNSFIPLNDDYKSSIIRAVSNGANKDILDFIMEYSLETTNCIHFLKWDFVNKNILREFDIDGFQCLKMKRGMWTGVLIYDEQTKFLYCLMNQKRFSQLQERNNRNSIHYIDALALLNKRFKPDPKEYEQISVFNYTDIPWESKAEDILKDILQQINGEVNCFSLISFTSKKYEITSATAYIPTVRLDIAHEEDWNEFIVPDYGTINIVNNYMGQDDENDLGLKIRSNIISLNDENNVKIKKEQEEIKKE